MQIIVYEHNNINKLIVVPPKTKITLTDAQKYEFCLYAHHTPGTRIEYVNNNGTSGLANLQYHEFFRKRRRSDFRLRLMHRKQKDIYQYFNNYNTGSKNVLRKCGKK